MLFDILTQSQTLADLERLIFYAEGSEAGKYFRRASPELPCFPQVGSNLGKRMAAAFEFNARSILSF